MVRRKSFNSIRNYQVDTKDRAIRKEKKEINYKYNYSKTVYKFLFIFISAIALLLITPSVFGNFYDYRTVKTNEINNLNNDISFSIKNVSFSSNGSLLRTDLQLLNNSSYPILANLKLNAETKSINNREEKIKDDIVKISDDYYVIYSHIDSGYEVAKLTLTLENKSKSKLETSRIDPIEFYVNEKELNDTPSMKVGTHKELFIETKNQQINDIEKEIKGLKNELISEKESQIAFKKSIESLEEERNYSVGEDLTNLEDEIKSNLSNIDSSEEKSKEINDKISGLEKKKTVIQTYIDDMK